MYTRLFSCEYRALSTYMWVVYAWVMIGGIDDSIVRTVTVVSVNGPEEVLQVSFYIYVQGYFHMYTGLFSYVYRALSM